MSIERSKNPALFFSNKERQQIKAAIQKAEKKTSGEIRVHLERKARENLYEHAKEIFKKIGMTETEEHNGVLILLGLASRRFVILGDKGIDEKVPEGFWQEMIEVMKNRFKDDLFAEGIVEAVDLIGEKLGAFFPYQRDDVNELTDEISYSI